MAGQLQNTAKPTNAGGDASTEVTVSMPTEGAANQPKNSAKPSQSLALATTRPFAGELTIQTQYSKPLPGNRPIRPGGLPNPVTYTTFKSSSLPGERPIAISQLKTVQTDYPLPANRPIASNQTADSGINTLIGYLD